MIISKIRRSVNLKILLRVTNSARLSHTVWLIRANSPGSIAPEERSDWSFLETEQSKEKITIITNYNLNSYINKNKATVSSLNKVETFGWDLYCYSDPLCYFNHSATFLWFALGAKVNSPAFEILLKKCVFTIS